MAFPADILRAGVKVANTLTKGAQATVIHEAWLSSDLRGKPTYASGVPLDAVIDYSRKSVPTGKGEFQVIVATLTFVGDVAPNGAAGRHEPIDTRDKITLPDGTTGPIISGPGSVIDPATGRGFINAVMIGAK